MAKNAKATAKAMNAMKAMKAMKSINARSHAKKLVDDAQNEKEYAELLQEEEKERIKLEYMLKAKRKAAMKRNHGLEKIEKRVDDEFAMAAKIAKCENAIEVMNATDAANSCEQLKDITTVL
jgi:hypothetical protein